LKIPIPWFSKKLIKAEFSGKRNRARVAGADAAASGPDLGMSEARLGGLGVDLPLWHKALFWSLFDSMRPERGGSNACSPPAAIILIEYSSNGAIVSSILDHRE